MFIAEIRPMLRKAGGLPLVLCMALLMACGGQKHSEGGLTFKDWYVIKPLPSAGGSVAYGTIRNSGPATRTLKSVAFGCAETADLHETVSADNRVKMVNLPPLVLATGESVAFEPGHKHIMLRKITAQNSGECVATFTFTDAAVQFPVPVRERSK